MKAISLFFTIFLALPDSVHAQTSRLASPLVQMALKTSGRKILEVGAREAVEKAAEKAIRILGGEAAERAMKRGGIELLEASLRHGDDVLHHAGRVPEAARYLGARPQQALSLVTRYGDDALRLEARVPGAVEQAVSLFGRGALPVLAKTAPQDVTRLMGYASRADSPITRNALWEAFKKEGSALLTKVDQHKTLILASGLTASMLTVADGVQDAIESLPEKAPEVIQTFASRVSGGLANFLMILAAGSTAVAGWWVWLRRPMRRS